MSDNLADADTNISMLARVFDRVEGLHPTMDTIAHEPTTMLDLLKARDLEFEKHIPNHAIVGFGVLNNKHRMFREVSISQWYKNRDDKDQISAHYLEKVKIDVEELVKDSEEYSKMTGLPLPVGDICNRFFLISHKSTVNTEVKELKLIQQRLRDHVDSLKARLLTVRKTELGLVSNLIILGAGEEKAHIAHFLLSGTMPAQPHVIVTDKQCAERILKMDNDVYAY